ncbi:hypothetical protein ACOMHN_051458 [Nucella lapillus]
MIAQWTREKHLRYLGVPGFLGSGQHRRGDNQYRFLVLQRHSFDLQKIFVQSGRCLPETTVLAVALRMLDALEYIHDNGYCHGDVKAANILLGFHHGETDFNQVYLVDYGLAAGYLVEGSHKPYRENPKRVHDGTAEYASRDAHIGAGPSRRGDLETLGYCVLEWLSGQLPWLSALHSKDRVRDLKARHMTDVPGLLKACFGTKPCPEGVRRYLEMVAKLTYSARPNYQQLRQVLRSGLEDEWMLGLREDTSQARGVKRGKERAGLFSPQQRKLRSGSCSTSARPAPYPTQATNGTSLASSSRRVTTPAGGWRNTQVNSKATPAGVAIMTPSSAVSGSRHTERPVPRLQGPTKCSVISQRSRPAEVLILDDSSSLAQPGGRNRTLTRAGNWEGDRGYGHDPGGGYSREPDEVYVGHSEGTPYQEEEDGMYRQDHHVESDEEHNQESDAEDDERYDWTDRTVPQQDLDDGPTDEEEHPTHFTCRIL